MIDKIFKGAGKFLGSMVGSGVGASAEQLAGAVNKVLLTPGLRAELAAKSEELQTELAKLYAGHRTLFVAGARPFILWVCGAVLVLHFMVFPVWLVIAPDIVLPLMDWQEFRNVVYMGLGLGILRTIEKQKGVAK